MLLSLLLLALGLIGLYLGAEWLVRGAARMATALLRFDFVALLVFSAAMALVLRSGHRVSRLEGVVLLLGYGGFVLALLLR